MRPIFVFITLLLTIPAFSQSPKAGITPVLNFKTYGYIDGIRLDSIDATYATYHYKGKSIAFNYGQAGGKMKEMLLIDEKGSPLIFKDSYYSAFLLNFFRFNGWDYFEGPDAGDSNDKYFLKKRD